MRSDNLAFIITIIFLQSCAPVNTSNVQLSQEKIHEVNNNFETSNKNTSLEEQIQKDDVKVSPQPSLIISPTVTNIPLNVQPSTIISTLIPTTYPKPTVTPINNQLNNSVYTGMTNQTDISGTIFTPAPVNTISTTPIPEATISTTSTPISVQSIIPTPSMTPTSINVVENQTLNISNIENLIWEKTNEERQKAGLSILSYENKIASIARDHSKNMAENNFFSHTDPEGLSASDRISKGYPELFSAGSSENIAYNFGKTDEEAAENLMKAWMNSTGHRANILNSSLTYIGIGIYIKNSRIYATQSFIKPVSVPVTDLSKVITYGESTNLTFKFYSGVINKDNLTVFVKFPDSTAKFYLPNNSYFTGQGKYIPQWENELFTINLTCDKGKGDYLIKLCENNNCYNTNYKITVN